MLLYDVGSSSARGVSISGTKSTNFLYTRYLILAVRVLVLVYKLTLWTITMTAN